MNFCLDSSISFEQSHTPQWAESIFGLAGPNSIGLLEELLENCGPMITIIDPDDRIAYANKTCREALSICKNETPHFIELMKRNFAAGLGVKLQESSNKPWLPQAISRRSRSKYRAFEIELIDGRWFLNTESMQPNGWMIVVGVDITSLRAPERALRTDRDLAMRAAETDYMTGISNRRHIFKLLEDFLTGKSAFSERPCAACILDIDHFKKINDKFGHQIGDDVIKGFAHTLRHTSRLRDCIGRLGGEEFLMLLPDSTMDAAITLMDRLRSEVRQSELITSNPEYSVTFSAGITMLSKQDTVDQIYARCDSALYLAKAQGRDRVAVADSMNDLPSSSD